MFLFYRNHDELPVAAISVLKQDCYNEYNSVLKEGNLSPHAIYTLNSIAVWPELWGQGYAKEALQLCISELKQDSIEVSVGKIHPMSKVSRKLLKSLSNDNQIYLSFSFSTKTMSSETLYEKFNERRIFAFAIWVGDSGITIGQVLLARLLWNKIILKKLIKTLSYN